MKTFTVYLLRHGISDFVDGRPAFIGSTDLPLSEQGALEAGQAGEKMREHKVDAVFCSNLKRSIQTAQLIYPAATPVVVDAIAEYHFGSLENKSFEEVMGAEYSWDDIFDAVAECDDAEPSKEYADRIFDGFSKIITGAMKSGAGSIAIVSHGVTIMHLMAKYTFPKLDFIYDWACENCCGFVLKTDTALWSRDEALETKGVIYKGEVSMFEQI